MLGAGLLRVGLRPDAAEIGVAGVVLVAAVWGLALVQYADGTRTTGQDRYGTPTDRTALVPDPQYTAHGARYIGPYPSQHPFLKRNMRQFALPLVKEKTRIENPRHAHGPFSLAIWSWTAPLKPNNHRPRPQLGVPFAGKCRRVDFSLGHRFVRTSVGLS